MRGVASIVAAALLLERLDDLAGTGPHADARNAFADADKKAMATLALRGFDAKELSRVKGLVDAAHAATANDPAPAPATDEQEQRLLALKAWYDDWSTTARALFSKRGDLIKLGPRRRPTRELRKDSVLWKALLRSSMRRSVSVSPEPVPPILGPVLAAAAPFRRARRPFSRLRTPFRRSRTPFLRFWLLFSLKRTPLIQ